MIKFKYSVLMLLISVSLSAQNVTVSTVPLPEFMKPMAVQMKKQGLDLNQLILKDDGRWGIMYGTSYMDLYKSFKDRIPLIQAEVLTAANGQQYSIFNNGDWQEGALTDLSVSALNPSMVTVAPVSPNILRAGRSMIESLEKVAIKKDGRWGTWLLNRSSPALPDYQDGQRVANAARFPLLVQGENGEPYTLNADGTWKEGAEVVVAEDKFAARSGTYEGLATVRIGTFDKKRFTRIKAFFPGKYTNTRGRKPHFLFYVEIFTSQKAKKVMTSYYAKSDYAGAAKKHSLEENGPFYALKDLRQFGQNFLKFTFDDQGVMDIDSEFNGTFNQVADAASVDDLRTKYYGILLNNYKIENGYLQLLKYQGNMGRLTIAVDQVVQSLNSNEIDVIFDHKVNISPSNANFAQEENRAKREIFQQITNNRSTNSISMVNTLPHVKTFNFISKYNPEARYVLTLPEFGEPTLANLKRSEALNEILTSAANDQAEAEALAKRNADEERINSYKKLTPEFAGIKAAEEFLPASERINFKRSGIHHYLLFENIYHGLFNQVKLGDAYIAKNEKSAYAEYIMSYSNQVALLRNPVPLDFEVQTVKTQFGRSRVDDSKEYKATVEEEYRPVMRAFLNEVMTTNGFRALFDLYVSTTGKVQLKEDIVKIYRLFPPYSKPAIRFRENLNRVFSNAYLRTSLPPISTKESVNTDYSHVNVAIGLAEFDVLKTDFNVKLHDREKVPNGGGGMMLKNNIFEELYENSFFKEQDRVDVDDILNEKLVAQVLKCTYSSGGKKYTLYFWKDKKPDLKSTTYYDAARIDAIIGPAQTEAPKNLTGALLKFHGVN